MAKKEQPSETKKMISESARNALKAPAFVADTIKTGFDFMKDKPAAKKK